MTFSRLQYWVSESDSWRRLIQSSATACQRRYTGNRTADAWVLSHTAQEGRLWLICLHGIGMGDAVVGLAGFSPQRLPAMIR